MITTLYQPFQQWSTNGSIFILSDLHFSDKNSKLIDPSWVDPEKQIEIINNLVHKNDTFVCLGDVGEAMYVEQIKAGKKILLTGNHDRRSDYVDYFDEIYTGPLFISDKILLSHEPVHGLPWCINIHGHDHNNKEPYQENCKYLNLAANRCNFTPVNLGKLIKEGLLSDIKPIHRMTIDKAVDRKNSSEGYILHRNDFEALNNLAEDVITSLRFTRFWFDEEGRDVSAYLSEEEISKRMIQMVENTGFDYLYFANNIELKQMTQQEAYALTLQEIKEKYLKNDLFVARKIMRTDAHLYYGAKAGDDVPDSFLDDLVALRWKENLKLWLLYFSCNKEKEENNAT